MKPKKLKLIDIPAIVLSFALAAAGFLVILVSLCVYTGVHAVVSNFKEIVATVFSFRTVVIIGLLSMILYAVMAVRRVKLRSYNAGLQAGALRERDNIKLSHGVVCQTEPQNLERVQVYPAKEEISADEF